MKKLLCLVALLGACSAQTIPDTAASESALVAPRPIGGCSVILCPKGTVCEESCGQARCVPVPKPECVTDADCRLFSDYCEGCNCVALGDGEPDPKCSGNVVQCLVDPCRNLQARCEYGSCVAGDAAL
ncbi:MAG TPA: hypothetical protein VJR89_03580 [Polyangiales bacterium]|nr:hypothetical protein [Polyangiales bacterium]